MNYEVNLKCCKVQWGSVGILLDFWDYSMLFTPML